MSKVLNGPARLRRAIFGYIAFELHSFQNASSQLGGRFFQLSNAIFCYQLTPIQFTVYSFLVSSAGQKKVCWPSMKTIAANCGCSVNAARDAIRVLEQMGFIRCVKRYRDLPNGSVRQTSKTETNADGILMAALGEEDMGTGFGIDPRLYGGAL